MALTFAWMFLIIIWKQYVLEKKKKIKKSTKNWADVFAVCTTVTSADFSIYETFTVSVTSRKIYSSNYFWLSTWESFC